MTGIDFIWTRFFSTDELTIDYQFTFNLSKKDDRHYRQINFKNSPTKSDIDADFNIMCSVPAKINITKKFGRFAVVCTLKFYETKIKFTSVLI